MVAVVLIYTNSLDAEKIINANCPYELFPTKPLLNGGGKLKYGALLIHGLLDTPLFTALNIDSYGHVAVPFSPSNPHYGQNGDYPYATQLSLKDIKFGGYNRIECDSFDALYQLGLAKKRRRELTYNPDFNYMAAQIERFIVSAD